MFELYSPRGEYLRADACKHRESGKSVEKNRFFFNFAKSTHLVN
jgi:hypothetical protein